MKKRIAILWGGRRQFVISAVLVLLAFAAGFILRGGKIREGDVHAHDESSMSEASKKAEVWTCSMHPQIQLPKPGKCPICFMDLIPLDSSDDDEGGLRELSVSETAKALMEIQTVPVERRFVTAEVRMVGKVDYDETRVSYITAWVPGRLDRLFVDYTGVPVKKGDHMVSLYSPELLSAQQELLQALQAVENLEKSEVSIVRRTTEATVEAAREKLRLWGLTPEQIQQVEARGTAEDHITIFSPSSGIVINKNAQEGMYVNTGTRIYTVADLSHVWVNLDAYESDLQWLKYGQTVEFTTEAYPGEVFTGTISFIHPVLNEPTRTVKVRMNVSNESGRLKPGMFVRAVAKAHVATGGRIMDTELAGKWISPMHPEVVKDEPGSCDVCGMPLVRAESLGYVGEQPNADDKPLVIPASAPLLTGKRAIAYVEVPNQEKPTYEGREIVLGPRAGDFYLVKQGLSSGDRVVTDGAFKIDAELQIRAKPSMMTPDGGGTGGGHAHHGAMQDKPNLMHEAEGSNVDPAFQKQLAVIVDAYLEIQTALAEDTLDRAIASAKRGRAALEEVDMGLVDGDTHVDWMKSADVLASQFSALSEAADMEAARASFALLSEEIATMLTRFGVADGKLYKAWCPMAFDNRGASWIQGTEEINNPYFGEMMLRCGEVKEILQ